MKTTLHLYHFWVNDEAQAKEYAELRAKLKTQGLECFRAWDMEGGFYTRVKDLDCQEIELETKFLFDNQWNTATHRVFDWAESVVHAKSLRRGHYLEQTDEMRAIRHNTVKCRYCGAQEPLEAGHAFCPHCIGNEYLTAANLPLTRMKAIDDKTDCEPLTDEESAILLPAWRDAQLHGRTARDKARIAKARENIASSYANAVQAAKTEHDGFLWLMDAGLRTENVIYYKHTNTFCLGWRKPVEAEELEAWLEATAEFPFTLEIKRA